ncbi:MAG: 4-hydroxybenzoate octaprenyltransferase [Alphaproteobacteria bacterium MarineAlpha12_Bin1]|nr:MAG: 4-hydroxybenzoate octaprenyltransferase [Alphaproteobacteria bacterium MarineAlpha12_Bin1]
MIDSKKNSTSDIPRGNWVDQLIPKPIRPYIRLARLDRPIGTWLLLLPGWWSLSLAKPASIPDISFFILFGVGALFMRGAGCIVNDLFDRNLDIKVLRTSDRPLASGLISPRRAIFFLLILLSCSFVILIQFNSYAIAVGSLSLLLVVPYPLMKRITWWPQAWLGLTFNWGALLGWAVINADITIPALLLYASGFFWTLAYDTIYAHQDINSDELIGIKSTALLFGTKSLYWITLFFTCSIVILGCTGLYTGIGWPFFIGLSAAIAHVVWQLKTINLENPDNCLKIFKSNRDFGIIVLISIIAGQTL